MNTFTPIIGFTWLKKQRCILALARQPWSLPGMWDWENLLQGVGRQIIGPSASDDEGEPLHSFHC
jgi:hypothetical protein